MLVIPRYSDNGLYEGWTVLAPPKTPGYRAEVKRVLSSLLCNTRIHYGWAVMVFIGSGNTWRQRCGSRMLVAWVARASEPTRPAYSGETRRRSEMRPPLIRTADTWSRPAYPFLHFQAILGYSIEQRSFALDISLYTISNRKVMKQWSLATTH
jgi:hypothetical protein